MITEENITTELPYLIQINDAPQQQQQLILPANTTLQQLLDSDGQNMLIEIVTEETENENIQIVQTQPKFVTKNPQQAIYQIVCPQELNLVPITVNNTSGNITSQKLSKLGRPKKGTEKTKPVRPVVEKGKTQRPDDKPRSTRTRSGRLVKFPRHIKNNFKKIDLLNENNENELSEELSDFPSYEEDLEDKSQNNLQFSAPPCRKRVITSQYKCLKCHKAYMGKKKMMEHLKKFPSHGPIPDEHERQHNFEAWNHLFNLTQKCRPNKRGVKFCEELSNLLHNVQLLKGALFKPLSNTEKTDNNDCVQVDKVLGNAIGLEPGKYIFNENELYKDVTVLQLITSNDFFKPTQLPENSHSSSDLLSSVSDLLLSNSTSNMLDNSGGLDEVMNVDQFVNERFKKIIEPDMDMGTNSLNLDLPSDLPDLFTFHN